MKRVLSILCIAALMACMMLGLSGCGQQDGAGKNTPSEAAFEGTVGILTFDGNTAEWVSAYKDGLSQMGNPKFVEQSAEGDASKLDGCIKALLDGGVNVVVAFGDEASVAAVNKGLSVPVLFIGVSDAVGLGLTEDLQKPDKNATGLEIVAPVEQLLFDISGLVTVHSYGIIYVESSTLGKQTVERMQAAIEAQGGTCRAISVSTKEEAAAAAASLAANQEAILVTSDAVVESALTDIVAAADAQNKPVFGYTDQAVQAGATLVSVPYDQIKSFSRIAYDIIMNGKNVADLPVSTSGKTVDQDAGTAQIYINTNRIEKFGYTLEEMDRLSNIAEKVEY